VIGKKIREYTIIEQIGEGGMGSVYLAEHSMLGKVAIKALAPQLCLNQHFRDRFIKEAKAQFALKHENIVQLHTVMEEGNDLFLVMEYIDGCSLDVFIENEKELDCDKALTIFKDILNGLNYAHSQGVIHRDVKPSNILITNEGKAKVMDFGIALMSDGKRLTKTGTTLGTAWYMSPEQISNPKNIDHRSDLYSAGIILYELLSGTVPFDGETDFNIYHKHIHEIPEDLTSKDCNISLTLSNILNKALEKNPDDRFNGCGEFLNYIIAYQAEEKGATPDLPDGSKIPSGKQDNIAYFFPTSTKKLVIMSIFTFNFYLIYWFYKNWKYIRDDSGKYIMPFWRAIFSVFFYHSLFKTIKEFAYKHNIDNNSNIVAWTVLYVIFTISGYLPEPFWIIGLFILICILPMQTLINNINYTLHPEVKINDKFSGLNILCIVFGFILFILIVIGLMQQ